MRLYLSSFRMGDHPERLVGMLEPAARAAVVANACDVYPTEDRRQGVDREVRALGELGVEAEELDLRAYFGERRRLAIDLARYQLVWVRGGNTFVLRHALAESGADAILTDFLARDAVVYGGYSAGVCVLAPSLRGLEIADEPGAVQATYGVPATWQGLGLLAYAVVPHYRSPGHPETEACERLAEHYRVAGVRYQTLRDGQAIVVNSGTTEIV